MKSGRIIRVFSQYQVAVNLGSDDRIKTGDNLGVFTPEEEITDPETGDLLGSYRQRKANLIVREVHERFSIGGPPARREIVSEPQESALPGIFSARPTRYRQVAGRLHINSSEVQPLPTGTTVSVGDPVFKLDDNGQPVDF